MAKSDSNKFSWKKGDVQIYKSVKDWKKANKKKSTPKPSRKGKK